MYVRMYVGTIIGSRLQCMYVDTIASRLLYIYVCRYYREQVTNYVCMYLDTIVSRLQCMYVCMYVDTLGIKLH